MLTPANPSPDSESESPKLNVLRIKFKHAVKHGVLNRDPAGATVNPGGSTGLNVNGTELLYNLARQGKLDQDTFVVGVGREQESSGIFLYADAPGTADTIPVRHKPDRRTCTFTLAPVFATHEIRPTSRRQCSITETTDQNGVPCLFLNLGVSLLKPQSAGTKKNTAAKPADNPITSTETK